LYMSRRREDHVANHSSLIAEENALVGLLWFLRVASSASSCRWKMGETGARLACGTKETRTCDYGRCVAEAVAVDEDVANINMNTECAVCISQSSFSPALRRSTRVSSRPCIPPAVAASASPNMRLEDSHRCTLCSVPRHSNRRRRRQQSHLKLSVCQQAEYHGLAGHCANGWKFGGLASKQEPWRPGSELAFCNSSPSSLFSYPYPCVSIFRQKKGVGVFFLASLKQSQRQSLEELSPGQSRSQSSFDLRVVALGVPVGHAASSSFDARLLAAAVPLPRLLCARMYSAMSPSAPAVCCFSAMLHPDLMQDAPPLWPDRIVYPSRLNLGWLDDLSLGSPTWRLEKPPAYRLLPGLSKDQPFRRLGKQCVLWGLDGIFSRASKPVSLSS
jgi:hypothetical protein